MLRLDCCCFIGRTRSPSPFPRPRAEPLHPATGSRATLDDTEEALLPGRDFVNPSDIELEELAAEGVCAILCPVV